MKKIILVCLIVISICTFSIAETIYVKQDGVNIRYGPGTNYRKIGKANKGEVFEVLREENGWHRIDMGGGKIGWIYGKLVSKNKQKESKCRENKMVDIGTYYIDMYEASKPDATAESSGSINTKACSVSGVLPWINVNFYGAKAACKAVGKRLCTADEWEDACDGTPGGGGYKYTYGDIYERSACVGRDSGKLVIKSTGHMLNCTSKNGVYDMSGNVEEWTNSHDDLLGGGWMDVRGGHLIDSKDSLLCSYNRGYDPSTEVKFVGFRCCQDKSSKTKKKQKVGIYTSVDDIKLDGKDALWKIAKIRGHKVSVESDHMSIMADDMFYLYFSKEQKSEIRKIPRRGSDVLIECTIMGFDIAGPPRCNLIKVH